MKSSLFLSHKNFFEENSMNKLKNKYFENLILKNNGIQFVFGDNNYFKNKYVSKTYLIFDKINFILLLKSIFIFSIKDYNLLKYIIKLYSYKPLRAKFDNNGVLDNGEYNITNYVDIFAIYTFKDISPGMYHVRQIIHNDTCKQIYPGLEGNIYYSMRKSHDHFADSVVYWHSSHHKHKLKGGKISYENNITTT